MCVFCVDWNPGSIYVSLGAAYHKIGILKAPVPIFKISRQKKRVLLHVTVGAYIHGMLINACNVLVMYSYVGTY